MFDLEANEQVQKAINDRQMPKIEYRKIEVEDYSKFCFPALQKVSLGSSSSTQVLPRLATALSLAHYLQPQDDLVTVKTRVHDSSPEEGRTEPLLCSHLCPLYHAVFLVPCPTSVLAVG